MKSALGYLTVTKIKNGIKDLKRHPARLIYVIFMVALLVLVFWAGDQDGDEAKELRDAGELTAGMAALYAVVFLLTTFNGFKNGATIFTMSDVNMLFPSPIKQQSILFYGLFRQMGVTLSLGIFIFFQYSWLHMSYGINWIALILIFLGFVFSAFLGQITAMVIYAFTSSSESARRKAKVLFYAIIIAFVGYVAYNILPTGPDTIAKLVQLGNGPVIHAFPVAGWLLWGASGIIDGNILAAVSGFGLCALLIAGEIYMITAHDSNYYEDVLKSTEISHNVITAKKEGSLAEAAPAKVKIGKEGLGRGFGANAFYYKHKLENRRARFFIFSTQQIIFTLCILGFTYFTKDDIGIFGAFSFATYLQLFSTALGRFNRELIKPYIYLVPEPPTLKLIHAIRESMAGNLLEAIIVMGAVGLMLGSSPLEIAAAILARFTFALLFIAGNVAVERIWGDSSSKVLVFILYFVVLIVMSAPGIVLASLVSVFIPAAAISVNARAFLLLSAANIPISFLVFWLCRNMLQYAELNNK